MPTIPYRFFGFFHPSDHIQSSTTNKQLQKRKNVMNLPYPDPMTMIVATMLKMLRLRCITETSSTSAAATQSSTQDEDDDAKDAIPEMHQLLPANSVFSSMDLRSWPCLERIKTVDSTSFTIKCSDDSSGKNKGSGGVDAIVAELEQYVLQQRAAFQEYRKRYLSAAAAAALAFLLDEADDDDDVSSVEADTSPRGFAADEMLWHDEMSSSQKQRYNVLEPIVKEKLLACVLCHWFANDENYDALARDAYAEPVRGTLLGVLLLPRMVRSRRLNQMASLLHVKRSNQVSMVQCFEILEESLEVLNSNLGQKKYLLSYDKPCMLDVYMYACLACMLYPHFEDENFSNLVGKYPRLVQYCEHISKAYFVSDGIDIEPLHRTSSAECTVQTIAASVKSKSVRKRWNKIFFSVAASGMTFTLLTTWGLHILNYALSKFVPELSDEDILQYEIED